MKKYTVARVECFHFKRGFLSHKSSRSSFEVTFIVRAKYYRKIIVNHITSKICKILLKKRTFVLIESVFGFVDINIDLDIDRQEKLIEQSKHNFVQETHLVVEAGDRMNLAKPLSRAN